MVCTAAFHARVRGSVPGLGGLKETKMSLPHSRVKLSIVGSLRDREVACSALDRQGSRTVSSHSSHHLQEILPAQFSLYVHKGGLKPDSFHFISFPMKVACWTVNDRPIARHGWIQRGRLSKLCIIIICADMMDKHQNSSHFNLHFFVF